MKANTNIHTLSKLKTAIKTLAKNEFTFQLHTLEVALNKPTTAMPAQADIQNSIPDIRQRDLIGTQSNQR